MALACLMAARLAMNARCAAAQLSRRAHMHRTNSARSWFASLTIPAAVRAACVRLTDATVCADPTEIGTALAGVLEGPSGRYPSQLITGADIVWFVDTAAAAQLGRRA